MVGYGVDIHAPRPPFVLFKVLYRNSTLENILKPLYLVVRTLCRVFVGLVGYLVGFMLGGGRSEGSGLQQQQQQQQLLAVAMQQALLQQQMEAAAGSAALTAYRSRARQSLVLLQPRCRQSGSGGSRSASSTRLRGHSWRAGMSGGH